MGAYPVEFSPGRWPKSLPAENRYRVIMQCMVTGQRLPTLIDAESGLPPRLALRWAFQRCRRWAPSTVQAELRQIGILYEFYDCKRGRDLDDFLISGEFPSESDVLDALYYAEHRHDPHLAGRITPTANGAVTGDLIPPRSFNRILAAWSVFLIWVARPRNFRQLLPGERSTWSRELTKELTTELKDFFAEMRRPEPRSPQGLGLTAIELELIELWFDAADKGRAHGFSPGTAERNRRMYDTGRWAGVRRGELLKICGTDTPNPLIGEDELRIHRRYNDPADPRKKRPPSVKTLERKIVLPTSLAWELWEFASRATGKSPSSPYLFLSQAGSPLSVDTADDIIRAIGRYTAEFARLHYPEVSHTLDELAWHRLRHTRAQELLPEYLAIEGGLEQFQKLFGWSDPRSMNAYVGLAMGRHASEMLRGIYRSRLEQEVAS